MTQDERRALMLAKESGFRVEEDRWGGLYCQAPSIGDDLAKMLVDLVWRAQADRLEDDGK